MLNLTEAIIWVFYDIIEQILGPGMSEKMWEVTIKHAKTCVLGNKNYVFRGPNYTIFLNPICQLMKAEINGSIYPTHNLSNMNRVCVILS